MKQDMIRKGESIRWRRVRLLIWIVVLALGLNVLTWVGAAWWPEVIRVWRLVSLLGFFLIGLLIGRGWALLVTLAYTFIHAIPVYLGLLPGYLSTWEEALWWGFALTILLTLTGLGVISRRAIRWIRSRFAPQAV